LDAGNIRKLVAIQINPTSDAATSRLYLFREGAESDRICMLAGVIPPMGARKVSWDLPDIGLTHGLFSIRADGLPTTNEDGLFSRMHA
jgi:hypothetical protein